MRAMIRFTPVLVIFGFLYSQTYVGSSACSTCHGTTDVTNAGYDIHATFLESGHPYKLNPVNGAAPTYPWSIVPNPPANVDRGDGTDTTFTWDDITYVIGGYGWKARFLDSKGYIITGANVQYNLETEGWSGYHSTEAIGTKKYNCGRCHTTGWVDSDDDVATNNQDGLEGLVGTFSEPGVQCEACHGPGSDHVAAPSSTNITKDVSSDLCGNCHYRDAQNRIEYKGGFIRHHEQYDEFLHSPHSAALTCNTCHNSHASTVYDDQALGDGVKMECATCHSSQATNMNHNPAATCVDCHMPEASKSAVSENEYNGDIKTHIFKINTEPVPKDSMVYYDDTAGKYFVRLDENDIASITLDYSCYGCHTDENGVGGGGSVKTLAELSAFAKLIHTPKQADNYIGSEACLSCHEDKTGWRTSLHANGISVPMGENSLVDLYGVVADANQNGIDDFKEGLDLATTEVFSPYGSNAPVLGYDEANDQYTVTIGDLTMPVMLTYGGSGLYKQRYLLKVPVSGGGFSASHYVSPIQYNEKTHEYVAYHPEAWYADPANGDYTPLFNTATTIADIVGSANTQKRSFEQQCIGCHATATSVSQNSDGEWVADAPDAGAGDVGPSVYDIDGDGTLDLIDTGCERCHGPGGNHFGDPDGIVNPEDLDAKQANDLCGFCHSRGASMPNGTFHYPYDDANMEDWTVGDKWSDYYSDHGGYYPDGEQGENEIRNSKKHHQQYFDFYESAKPTFLYHEVRCYECHDVHNSEKHHIRTEVVEEDSLGNELVIATENDDNTLCLSCHATHGPFEEITKEMVADPVANETAIAAVVTQHTNHDYDPAGTGESRCSKCHMPKTIKSAINYDIHSHTFEPISPQKTLEYGMPNACAASCHRGIENGTTPLFNIGVDASLSDWTEATDVALADTLEHWFGPGGIWWDIDQILATVEPVADGVIPERYSLMQNYPNPFNPTTVIPLKISNEGQVKVVLINVLGQEVATLMDKRLYPGSYQIVVNGKSLPTGVYFYRMTVETADGKSFVDQKKMVVLK